MKKVELFDSIRRFIIFNDYESVGREFESLRAHH